MGELHLVTQHFWPFTDCRLWAVLSILSWFVAICCGAHVVTRRPRLDVNNWSTTPSPTLAFLFGLFGMIRYSKVKQSQGFMHESLSLMCLLCGFSRSFIVAVWGVWRYWTLAIVPILLMGFISAISVFNL